jgi:hypothetical protein
MQGRTVMNDATNLRAGMQPIPFETMVGRQPIMPGLSLTIITRNWRPGDEQRCRLCDRCSASRRTHCCTVWTSDDVPKDAADLYSMRGRGAPTLPLDRRRVDDLGLAVYGGPDRP